MEVEEIKLKSNAKYETIDIFECKTPGRKIRSKGKGRGQARGVGKGPIGIPYKLK